MRRSGRVHPIAFPETVPAPAALAVRATLAALAAHATLVALAVLAALLLPCGCAPDFGTPASAELRGMADASGGAVRSWEDPLELDCGSVSVRTTLPADRARYACLALAALERRFRADFPGAVAGPRSAGSVGTVNLYAEQSAYRAATDRVGLHGTTGGFFNPATGEMHLLWKPIRRTHPALTLLHEGTHRLIHGAWAFPVPDPYRQTPGRQSLVSVPFWLQEGMATLYEAGGVTQDGLLEIRRNVPRLRQLRLLIASGTAPHVADVIATPFLSKRTSADYAVAWGLAYDLLYSPDPTRRRESRMRLRKYLTACRNGFYDDPDEGFRHEFGRGDLPPDFLARWDARIGRESLPAFRRYIVGAGESLEEWERAWQQRMRNLPLTPAD